MRDVYIYKTFRSESARLLRDNLRERGVPCRLIQQPVAGRGSVVVCWGSRWPLHDALRTAPPAVILNATKPADKLAEREMLARERHIIVPDFIRHGGTLGMTRTPVRQAPPGWLARVRNHQRALDLRAGRTVGDYYVYKFDFEREFRVHVFQGRTIRSGMKEPRPGFTPHPWIRSHESGWNINYGAHVRPFIRQAYRDAAKLAVAALHLDFGAVDLGVTANGDVVVLEVNTAPSLQFPATLKAYANKIAALVEV